MPRFYIKENIEHAKKAGLSEDQALQVQKVLRMKVGDHVEVFDGAGNLAVIQLERISRESTFGEIVSRDFRDDNAKVVIFQALPKNPKPELIIQKCTELNVAKIVFFASDHSVPKIEEMSKNKIIRWQKIAIEASEQSRRSQVPQIEFYEKKFSELIKDIQAGTFGAEFKFLSFLGINGSWLNSVKKESLQDFSAIFIGAEGGFSEKEKEIFTQNKFQEIKIANNVLRCETAGITFLSQYLLLT